MFSKTCTMFPSSRRDRLRMFDDPIVAARFELERQFLSAGPHDAAVHQHVNKVRDDVIQQTLVMCDEQLRPIGSLEAGNTMGNNLERVDIEAGIGFVEDGQL